MSLGRSSDLVESLLLCVLLSDSLLLLLLPEAILK